MSRRMGASFWLLAFSLMLLAALAVAWLAPGPLALWRTWQAPTPQPPSLVDIDAALLVANSAATTAYPAVLERPLMDATRRPQATASAPASAALAPLPNAIEKLKLQGIVAGPALNGVLVEEDGKSRFVRRGERVGDWTLDALVGRGAVFVRGGERYRIELPVAHGATPDTAVPSSASPPARAVAAQPPVPLRQPLPPSAPAPTPAVPTAAATDAPPDAPSAAFGGSPPPRRSASASR